MSTDVDVPPLAQGHAEDLRYLSGDTTDLAGRWSVEGTVGFASVGYIQVIGNFKLSDGRNLHLEGKLGGPAIAGGETKGVMVFDVDLNEVLAGPMFMFAQFAGIVWGECVLDVSRDLKHIGTYAGHGPGIGGGWGLGEGRFSIT